MRHIKLIVDLAIKSKISEAELDTIKGNIAEHITEENKCDIKGFKKLAHADVTEVKVCSLCHKQIKTGNFTHYYNKNYCIPCFAEYGYILDLKAVEE